MFNLKAKRNIFVNWEQLNVMTVVFNMLGISYKLSVIDDISDMLGNYRVTFKATEEQAQKLYAKLHKYGVQNG